jgi:hypothetical protein
MAFGSSSLTLMTSGCTTSRPGLSEAIIVSRLRDYRVLVVLANDIVIWLWIRSDDNYERLIQGSAKGLAGERVTTLQRIGWGREEWGTGTSRVRYFRLERVG